MPITLPLDLGDANISQGEADKNLVTIKPGGGLLPSQSLVIKSGLYYSGVGSSPQLNYTPFFDTAHVRDQIKAFEGANPATLTTALFSDIHLVKGQQLTINYDFQFGDDDANDFAFALLGNSSADSSPSLLADGLTAIAASPTAPHGHAHYASSQSYNVNRTGDYSLLLGSADALDQKQPSTLVVTSITISTQDKDYTVTPLGIKLADGTTYLANGGVALPNGKSIPGELASGAQGLLSFIVSHDAGGLISQDGGGIVSHDAGGIVSHDAGGIVSHDAGGLISQDGGSLISQDGGSFTPVPGSNLASIVSHDSGGFLGQNAAGVIPLNAAGIFSNTDYASIVATGGGNAIFHLSGINAYAALPAAGKDLSVTNIHLDKTFVKTGDTVNIAYQVGNSGGEDSGISTTKFYLSTDATVTTADTLLGSLPEPALKPGNAVSDTFDITIPAGLANGTYYIAAISDANGDVTETDETNNVSDAVSIYVGKPPTPAGPPFTPVPVGGEFNIGTAALAGNFALSLSNGNFAEIYSDSNNGLTLQIVDATGATVGSAVSPHVSSVNIQATELADGRIAAVYQTADSGIAGIIYKQDGTVSVPAFTLQAQAGYIWTTDSIAALSDGRFVVVENSYQNTGNGYSARNGLAQVVNGDGTTSVAPFAIAPTHDVPFNGVGVSQLPDGRVLFAFTENHGHNDYGVFFNSTFTQSTEVALATNAVYSGRFHAAPAMLDDGDIVDVYEAVIPGTGGQQDTYLGLRARIFHPDGTLVGNEIDLPGRTTVGQGNAKVVPLPTGGFIVAFQGSVEDGTAFGSDALGIQRYNDDGTANGNLVTISGTGAPSATLLNDGHLLATYFQDHGSNYSVVGQLFNLGPTTPGTGGTGSTTTDTRPAPPAGATGLATQTGPHEVTYTDSSGNTVVDTSDAINRLIKEIISNSAGSVLATLTVTYNTDGTYQTHGELLTGQGTLSVDVGFGPKGEVSEVVRDVQGNVTANTTITYNDDGSILRHTTVPGVPGSFDETIKGGLQVSAVHNDGAIGGYYISTSASETFTGGAGDDTFVFNPGGGSDKIVNFTAGAGSVDKIVLEAFPGLHTLDDVLALTSQQGPDAVIAFGNGDSITLQGVQKTALGADDFVLEFFGQPATNLAAFNAANGWTSENEFPRHLADVNGDGRADIVGFGNGGVHVSLANGDGTFAPQTVALAAFNPANGWTSDNAYHRELADVNGDGKADIVGFGIPGVLVSLATGDGNFGAPTIALAGLNQTNGWTSEDQFPLHLADVNGDGKADIVGFGDGGVHVSLATGNGNFAPQSITLAAFDVANGWTSDNTFHRELADVNGDGMADIVGFGIPGVLVSLATGNGNFAAPTVELAAFNPANGWTSQDQFPRHLADVNGDGVADIVGFGNGGVYVALATGGGHFASPITDTAAFNPNSGWSTDNQAHRELADIDHNGHADIVGFNATGVVVAHAHDYLLS